MGLQKWLPEERHSPDYAQGGDGGSQKNSSSRENRSPPKKVQVRAYRGNANNTMLTVPGWGEGKSSSLEGGSEERTPLLHYPFTDFFG